MAHYDIIQQGGGGLHWCSARTQGVVVQVGMKSFKIIKCNF
jgi:hypothetical protein